MKDFDATLEKYNSLKNFLKNHPISKDAKVSMYSDSILIVGDDLLPVLDAIVSIQWSALMENWLVRGGVAYGKYWEETDNGNLFVVSDALIRAVTIEKSIKIPAVAISKEINIDIELWFPRFINGLFFSQLLHFQGQTIVNPFNMMWFQSAILRVTQLLDQYPEHKDKYDWFLSLANSVEKNELLIPENVYNIMIKQGIIKI